MGRSLLISVGWLALVAISSVVGATERSENDYLPIELAPVSPEGEVVIVEKGDHLWSIAETSLGRQRSESPDPAEIRPYWVAIIDENTHRLRSGDPDLIYPGEKITLPAP